MNLSINYFGQLAEIVGYSKETITTNFKTIGELENFILSKHVALVNKEYVIAMNEEIVSKNDVIKESGKIAFLPPFSGG